MDDSTVIKVAINLATKMVQTVSEMMKEKKREENIRKQREMELALEEKRISARLKEAQENREFQEKQALIQAKNARDIAVFHAQAQKELYENHAEHRFVLDNFPLFVRKWSFRADIEKKEFLPVKIVMVPPGSGAGNMNCSGYENLLEAAVTRFLQDNIPGEYYEFLSGAWRGNQYRGQAAYKLIYEEFFDEPFLIIEYSFTRDTYVTLQICFWYPGSPKYQTVQLIENWDIREILHVTSNHGSAGKHERNRQSYDELFRMLAEIGAVISGSFVDCYQLLEGVSNQSYVLKTLPQTISLLTGYEEKTLQDMLTKWVISEYQCLVQSPALSLQAEQSCKASLADVLLSLPELKMRSTAIHYMKQAWNLWCTSMGFRPEELQDILDHPADSNEFMEMLAKDQHALEELRKIRNLYQKTMWIGRNAGLQKLTDAAVPCTAALQDKRHMEVTEHEVRHM